MLNIKAFLVKLFGLIFHSSISKEGLVLCGPPGVGRKFFKNSLALCSVGEQSKSATVDPCFPNTEGELTYWGINHGRESNAKLLR